MKPARVSARLSGQLISAAGRQHSMPSNRHVRDTEAGYVARKAELDIKARDDYNRRNQRPERTRRPSSPKSMRNIEQRSTSTAHGDRGNTFGARLTDALTRVQRFDAPGT